MNITELRNLYEAERTALAATKSYVEKEGSTRTPELDRLVSAPGEDIEPISISS
jgi:hypothetical protein